GLGTNTDAHKVWTCPNRPKLPRFEGTIPDNGSQWVIGYQYFGGITNWLNPACPNGVPSRSPVNNSTAEPNWCLAADVTMKADGYWGGDPDSRVDFSDLPAHHGSLSHIPIGGNELFVDGSVSWFKFEQMYFLTTWRAYNLGRQGFFYQDPS